MTNKEQVRKILTESELNFALLKILKRFGDSWDDETIATDIVDIREAFRKAGYHLQPNLDVNNLTVIDVDSMWKQVNPESPHLYLDMMKVQLTHTKNQIKNMMEGK